MKTVIFIGRVVTICLLGATIAMPASTSTGPNVKRVTSGVCYTRGQTGYDDARSYKSFESIEACLSAGGRLPHLKGFFGNGTPSSAPVAAQGGDNKLLFDTDATNIIKKSRDGFCHGAASSSFTEIVHFAAYRTMQDCLQSGGRAVAKQ